MTAPSIADVLREMRNADSIESFGVDWDQLIARAEALEELARMVQSTVCLEGSHDFRAFLHDRLHMDCGRTMA